MSKKQCIILTCLFLKLSLFLDTVSVLEGSGDNCLTTPESRDPGEKCIFPFKFEGKTYYGCPPDIDDPSKGGWCSTKTDSNGNHLSGYGAYGYCRKSCPAHSEID